MRIVLDASVAVAAQRPHEAGYAASRARLVQILTGTDTIVVPSFFLVEVRGALARLGFDPKVMGRLLRRLSAPPHELITVGPRGAKAASSVAIRPSLRGPDALYVWLARREAAPLCTLDREIITRGASLCQVIPP